VLLFTAYYFGFERREEVEITRLASLPTPTPTLSKYPEYRGWLNPDKVTNWTELTGNINKTVKYSYKYPEKLYMVKNIAGSSSYSASFFSDEESYRRYSDCIKNGNVPNEGENWPRNWEGACNLQNLLFTINIFDYGKKLNENAEARSLENYSAGNDIYWTIPKGNAAIGGMGESIYQAAEGEINNSMISLEIMWPNNNSISKTKEITGLDKETLLKQVLATLEVSIMYN
jgi:hypothetical protein